MRSIPLGRVFSMPLQGEGFFFFLQAFYGGDTRAQQVWRSNSLMLFTTHPQIVRSPSTLSTCGYRRRICRPADASDGEEEGGNQRVQRDKADGLHGQFSEMRLMAERKMRTPSPSARRGSRVQRG